MTPTPRRRASDEQDEDPMQTLFNDVALIKLHVAGGLGPDGPVTGLVGELKQVHERVSLLERIAKWCAGIAAGVIIGVAVWGATTAHQGPASASTQQHP